MQIMTILATLLAVGAPAFAPPQQRTLEDVEFDYDVSVRCAGIYGAAATGKEMQHFAHHPDVAAYRRYEQQFTRYTYRFGPQLRIPDAETEDAVGDVRGQTFRAAREALFAQDEAGFNTGLEALYALIPDCEAERVRLSRTIGIF